MDGSWMDWTVAALYTATCQTRVPVISQIYLMASDQILRLCFLPGLWLVNWLYATKPTSLPLWTTNWTNIEIYPMLSLVPLGLIPYRSTRLRFHLWALLLLNLIFSNFAKFSSSLLNLQVNCQKQLSSLVESSIVIARICHTPWSSLCGVIEARSCQLGYSWSKL